MNRNRILLIGALAGCCLGYSAFQALADADDKPVVEENVVTEVPVHVGRITVATLHDYVTGYGTVEAEPAGSGRAAAGAKLTSPTAGVVLEAPCVEGQRVKKGDLIFRLDSRAADLAVEAAEKNVSRQQQLLTSESTSPKALLEAEQQLAAARVQQAALRVESPVAGVIVSYKARAGEAVDTATVVAEITDPDRLVVTLRIPSAEAERVAADQPVEIFAGPAGSVTGKVTFVSPQVDAATDTVVARVSLPSPPGLRAGQFVSARIVGETRKDRLVVPVESVSLQDGTNAISVVTGDKAVQTPVKTGLREGGLVEVEGEGLKAGLTVVTLGAYALPKETKVRVLDK